MLKDKTILNDSIKFVYFIYKCILIYKINGIISIMLIVNITPIMNGIDGPLRYQITLLCLYIYIVI